MQSSRMKDVTPSVRLHRSFGQPARTERILTRVRTGHVRLTRGYILRSEQLACYRLPVMVLLTNHFPLCY
jgi:hypothetical protein